MLLCLMNMADVNFNSHAINLSGTPRKLFLKGARPALSFHECPYSIAHDDVIKWKHFPRYWPFVRGIHRSTVNSPHKGQWRGALMFSLIWVWINGWVNNRETGDLRRNRAHYDVIVMGWVKIDQICIHLYAVLWSHLLCWIHVHVYTRRSYVF